LPQSLDDVRYELALANRIVAHEGVLDAFGHVSMRHPDNPGRYLLARSRSPELIEPGDIFEFDLDSQPVVPPAVTLYRERVIHGEIYKARPDVMAVCHHHSAAVLPFAITGRPLQPVYHLGSVIGEKAPFWDQRDEFGDTNLLVEKPEEGQSLARALGTHWVVLMRRHGATVAGTTLGDCVFRTIYSCRNAEYQLAAERHGTITTLSRGEAEMAGKIHQDAGPLRRAWEYWAMRLDKAGGNPPPAGARRGAATRSAPARRPRQPAARKAKAAAKKKTAKKGRR
jgi:ribulose-5-phosphate 4-epimerase/fuculose-1-phosphate aldolase